MTSRSLCAALGLTLAVGVGTWPRSAGAWPVDWAHEVDAGKEKFVRLPGLDWLEVEDKSVLQAEWLESGELLLTGLKPGRTLVLLGFEGKVAAWRVRVNTPALKDPGAWAAAQKACPTFASTPLEDVALRVTVSDDACRKALAGLFAGDAIEARHLELTFDGRQLQAQLVELMDALKPIAPGRVRGRYVGAGLVLEGTVTEKEHRKILWEVLRHTLGRFALDDQLHVDAPDAGTRP